MMEERGILDRVPAQDMMDMADRAVATVFPNPLANLGLDGSVGYCDGASWQVSVFPRTTSDKVSHYMVHTWRKVNPVLPVSPVRAYSHLVVGALERELLEWRNKQERKGK